MTAGGQHTNCFSVDFLGDIGLRCSEFGGQLGVGLAERRQLRGDRLDISGELSRDGDLILKVAVVFLRLFRGGGA